jgi:hypothetical protein
MRTLVLGAALAASVASPGAAIAGKKPEPGTDYVIVEPQPRLRERGLARTIFLNRCASGCTLAIDRDDATMDASSIPDDPGPLSPFAFGDPVWDQVVACMRQTYSAFDVEIVTERPAGDDYIHVMVAGSPSELGLDANILGIAPLSGDCSPQRNVMAFAFSNIHADGDFLDICATAAHEAGHVFGLDHEFICQDPMTYLTECGQKQFLNLEVECGEFTEPRECRCGDRQNSFQKLLDELGGGVFPGPPAVTIQAPANGSIITNGINVFATTVEPRVIIRTELWINGWRWADGGSTPEQDLFMIPIPAGVPDGVIDLEVRAINDVGAEGTATIQVTKGLPCTAVDACAPGQSCDSAGRCVYPTPAGQVGDTCTRDLDCATTRCASDGSNRLCTDDCMVGLSDCGDGFTCIEASSPTAGLCWPSELVGEPGGCCQSSDHPVRGGVLALATLALVLRPRRRRH